MPTLREVIEAKIAALEATKATAEAELAAQKAALEQHGMSLMALIDRPVEEVIPIWRWMGSHLPWGKAAGAAAVSAAPLAAASPAAAPALVDPPTTSVPTDAVDAPGAHATTILQRLREFVTPATPT